MSDIPHWSPAAARPFPVPFNPERRQVTAKRLVDLGLVLLAAPLVLPLLALLAAVLALTGQSPFYRHARVGRHGRRFRCLKLRTMDDWPAARLDAWLAANPAAAQALAAAGKIPDDPRISALGRILRRTSLDELPQLWNVARGEMSLVGPRPITRPELAAYDAAQRRAYLAVAPGLTGLWQVEGRSQLCMARRAALDAEYVRRMSLALDLAILLRTVPVVLRMTGA